jgi:hypothetical protein
MIMCYCSRAEERSDRSAKMHIIKLNQPWRIAMSGGMVPMQPKSTAIATPTMPSIKRNNPPRSLCFSRPGRLLNMLAQHRYSIYLVALRIYPLPGIVAAPRRRQCAHFDKMAQVGYPSSGVLGGRLFITTTNTTPPTVNSTNQIPATIKAPVKLAVNRMPKISVTRRPTMRIRKNLRPAFTSSRLAGPVLRRVNRSQAFTRLVPDKRSPGQCASCTPSCS